VCATGGSATETTYITEQKRARPSSYLLKKAAAPSKCQPERPGEKDHVGLGAREAVGHEVGEINGMLIHA
jgi:hypothetical protein